MEPGGVQTVAGRKQKGMISMLDFWDYIATLLYMLAAIIGIMLITHMMRK